MCLPYAMTNDLWLNRKPTCTRGIRQFHESARSTFKRSAVHESDPSSFSIAWRPGNGDGTRSPRHKGSLLLRD